MAPTKMSLDNLYSTNGWTRPASLDLLCAKSNLDASERAQEVGTQEFNGDIQDTYTLYFKPMSHTLLGENRTLSREFFSWAKPTINSACNTLKKVYLDYGILPHLLLEILGRHKAHQMAFDNEVKQKLRRKQVRVNDQARIKEAARLVLLWLPYTPLIRKEIEQAISAASLISRLADSLPLLGPSVTHRPNRPHLEAVTLELYQAFVKIAGPPQTRSRKISYYDATGDLLQIAFRLEYTFRSNRDLGKMLTRARKN